MRVNNNINLHSVELWKMHEKKFIMVKKIVGNKDTKFMGDELVLDIYVAFSMNSCLIKFPFVNVLLSL